MTISLNLKKNYDKALNFSPPEWNGMSMPHGYFMVQSLGSTNNYVYSSFGAAYKFGNKMELMPIKNEIHVFNKKTGKFVTTIWNDKLKSSSVGYSIIGVTSKYIVLSAVSVLEKELMKDITPDYNKNMIWFIIMKNPLGE